jgi:transposase
MSKKLKHDRRGGSSGNLTEAQEELLRENLRSNLYPHKHQIVAYVEERWGVKYSISGMQKWLERNRFVYKKPKAMPYKACAKEQEVFVEKYKALKCAAAKNNEPILFMDAAHPTQATKLAYGWIEKGKDKIVHSNGTRTRINVVGAVQLDDWSKTLINCMDGSVNADVLNAFLPQIRANYPENQVVHLIMDHAGYHKAESVQDMSQKLNIRIHFLPAHSPNLNPIERLWKIMTKKARNNEFFASSKIFRQKIDDFFKETLPNMYGSLSQIINDNFERI